MAVCFTTRVNSSFIKWPLDLLHISSLPVLSLISFLRIGCCKIGIKTHIFKVLLFCLALLVCMYVCKYFTWFTGTNIFLRCNLSDPIYSVGPMTGSKNFKHMLGVLTASSIKGRVDPTSIVFLVLYLRLLTIVFCEKGSYQIQCFYCFNL